MSRIGKKPVAIPDKVTVAVSARTVTVSAGKNALNFTHRPEVAVKVDADAKQVVVERTAETRQARAMHGLTRAILANMIEGVTTGFKKELEINGVGWGAVVQGNTIVLSVGYADKRKVTIPAGVKVEVNQNRVMVSGADRQMVGQVAADIRRHRPPEPYNGKGIKYVDEVITRKQGKAFAGGGAG
mgnify:CR=1 FL=1